ncbi:MAG: tRNA uridine-5-carboxymethylaminomethyl(34) synthesis GTPase MnmE [Nitrospinae bacterium]|nr:tRNA uridine-5-carboxymethylaminomethyl(34) synthesis GTPase MnmE [Nitrospinota bacterium]
METIVALATFPSSSASLNVIRISGAESKRIITELFIPKTKKELSHNLIRYGYIHDPKEGINIDDIVLLPYFAPKSYTGEDLFEIICHGGNFIYKKIISLFIQHGARAAEHGEFTRRAFANNKIDLTQAEAINDIVNSENDVYLELARKNLDGAFNKEISQIRNLLIDLVAEFETSINFPEDVEVHVDGKKIDGVLSAVTELLNQSAFNEDIHIEDVLILGEPNVGKSSLLNCLLGQEKSIVTDISGTTRDLIEHKVEISGIKLNLIDTAGIKRNSQDIVETIGINKALDKISHANTILFMLDATQPIDITKFQEIYTSYLKDIQAEVIFVLNKIDISSGFDLSFLPKKKQCIQISAKNEQNIQELKNAISASIKHTAEEVLGKSFLINMRQKELIEKCINELQQSKKACDTGEFEEVVVNFLNKAQSHLEKIIGSITDEEVLDQIFSSFCIGK